MDDKKSLPNASRANFTKVDQTGFSYEKAGDETRPGKDLAAEITFKMPKNKDSFILVQGQSQH